MNIHELTVNEFILLYNWHEIIVCTFYYCYQILTGN